MSDHSVKGCGSRDPGFPLLWYSIVLFFVKGSLSKMGPEMAENDNWSKVGNIPYDLVILPQNWTYERRGQIRIAEVVSP